MPVHGIACAGFRTCRAAEVLYWPHELDRMCAPSAAQYSKHSMAFDNVPVPLESKNLQAAAAQCLVRQWIKPGPQPCIGLLHDKEACSSVDVDRIGSLPLGTHISSSQPAPPLQASHRTVSCLSCNSIAARCTCTYDSHAPVTPMLLLPTAPTTPDEPLEPLQLRWLNHPVNQGRQCRSDKARASITLGPATKVPWPLSARPQ